MAGLALVYHSLPEGFRFPLRMKELMATAPAARGPAVAKDAVEGKVSVADLPVVEHPIVFAPHVPPPIIRSHPALVKVNMESSIIKKKIHGDLQYEFWSFNGEVPGPFIRCR